MTTPERDPGLDTLLDLHGQTLLMDDIGHWVKFVVVRTEATAERRHGLNYSPVPHALDGEKAGRLRQRARREGRRGTGHAAAQRARSSPPAAVNPAV